MQDANELNERSLHHEDDDSSCVEEAPIKEQSTKTKTALWEPSNVWWKDFLYFSGSSRSMSTL